MTWITAAAEECATPRSEYATASTFAEIINRHSFIAWQALANESIDHGTEAYLAQKKLDAVIAICRANLHPGVNPGRQDMAGLVLDTLGVERFPDLSKGNKEHGNDAIA